MPAGKPNRSNKKHASKPYDHPSTGPLGSTSLVPDDEALKGEEEKDLESYLFGKKRAPKVVKSALNLGGKTAEEKEKEVVVDSVMAGMADSELFFMDAPGPSNPVNEDDEVNPLDVPFSDDEDMGSPTRSDSDDSDSESNSGSDSGSESDASSSSSTSSSSVKSIKKSNARKAAWQDPDDAKVKVSLRSQAKLKKLRQGEEEDVVGGRDYERRLKTQFESLNPRPQWATTSASKGIAGQDPLQSLLSSSSPFIASSRARSSALPSGDLDIERIKDVKGGEEGPVRCLGWAPSTGERNILTVAGSDRRVRIYNIDGPSNPLLSTIHIPSLPIDNLKFHPHLPQVLLTGKRPFLHVLSLATSTSARLPLLPPSSNLPAPKSLSSVSFSPDGSMLACAGAGGSVYLVSWGMGGPQGLIALLKNPGGSGKGDGIDGLHWAKGGKELWTMGALGGEVCVWDVGARRCVSRWRGSNGGDGWGGFGAKILEGNERAGLCAVGSSTGIVNLYENDYSTEAAAPKLVKSFDNITTSISSMCFNPDGQILAAASKEKKDTLKLYHTASMTTFQNWPTASTPLGVVTSLGWSSKSEYLAIGNQRGKVLLYRARAFGSY